MHHFYCSKCGAFNSKTAHTCISCGEIINYSHSDLQSLKEEMIALKSEYESKLENLLDKIEYYNSREIERKNTAIESVLDTSSDENKETVVEKTSFEEEKIIENFSEETINRASLNYEPENDPVVENHTLKSDIAQESPVISNTEYTIRKESKSIQEIVKSIPLISLLLEIISAPLAGIWDYVKKVYTVYKDKNQLPVFFMTLAGVGALLFGFGYLMQLSLGYFGELSEIVKISIGFASSSAIAVWATQLHKKEEKYKEFSSALIGLAVALNYLFIYFLANMSNTNSVFSSAVTGFILIGVNTVFAIFFALRYETKVVAVLSLLGGAFAPFYLNSDGGSITYFAYLWMLSISSIYIANKIKWKTLGVITFITSSSIIEMAVYNSLNSFSLVEYTILFHAFAYLFIWVAMFKGRKISSSPGKVSVILLAANISIFLINLYYLFSNSEYYTALGAVYIVNALLFFPVLWMLNKDLNKPVKLLLLVIAGTFVALAIPALFNEHLMGLFWSVEALGLIYLGFSFSIPSVRKEGYILLALAIFKILLTFDGFWFIANEGALLTGAYYNSLVLGIITLSLVFLLKKFKTENLDFENKLSVIFRNFGSVWFVSVYIITVSFYTYNWLAFAMIPAAFAVISTAYSLKLKFSRIFGYIVFSFSVIYSSIIASVDIFELWDSSIFSVGYANLVGIGGYLIALQFLLYKLHSKRSDLFEKEIKLYLNNIYEIISVWFTVLFLVTGFYTIGNYTFSIAVIPMFALIYWGNKRKLLYTEYIGLLAYSLIILLGISISVAEVDTMRFSKQLLWGKMSILEVLFVMWALKSFYEKILHVKPRNRNLNFIREVFYWIIPLTIISPVRHNFPELLPAALWGSVLISFIIYEITKRKSLITEFTILTIIAATMGLISDYYYYAVPVSLVVLTIVFIRKDGFKKELSLKSEFAHIFNHALYYIGAGIFVISSDVFDSTSNGLIITSLYLSNLVLFRKRIIIPLNNYLVAFWISLLLSASVLVLKYDEGGTGNQILSLITLIPFGIILYGKNTIYSDKRQTIWIYLIVVLHVLLLLSYSLTLGESQLTIVLIIHAIILLFNSMKKHFKSLVWLSVAFFGIAVVKLFIWDIAHFTMLQKVIVFIVIGALLIGASFMYVKLKEKFEEIE